MALGRTSRFLREAHGFAGAEKALLITFALAILILIGHLVGEGSDRAGAAARRTLEEHGAGTAAFQGAGAFQTARVQDEGGEEAPVAAVAAVQPARAPAAPQSAPELTAREQFLREYRAWLDARMREVDGLRGEAKVSRVEGLLIQMRDVAAQLEQGTVPDLAGLDAAPAPQETDVAIASTHMPPELVANARRLIQIVERPVDGATGAEDAVAGGSLYSARDWNSLLGVPQYRTQSDNLAGPEVTCNVTSMAMIAERLGYDRRDVMSAIDRQLKLRFLREQGRDPSGVDLATVELPANYFQSALGAYLRANNNDPQGYRRLRGQTATDAQRAIIARQFRDRAQMEDALDFLLHTKGISRYEVAVRPADVLLLLAPDEAQRPTAQIYAPGPGVNWAEARRQMQQVLAGGGAVMLSLYHKGAGQDGTHLISIQAVTPTGVIVDDPYGRIRPTYNRGRAGDAYADPGRTRADSPYRNVVTRRDTDGDGVDDDWTLTPSQAPVADETRGNSVELPDAVLASAWNRITVYRRPPPAPRPAG